LTPVFAGPEKTINPPVDTPVAALKKAAARLLAQI